MLEFFIKGYVAFCIFVQTETIISIIYKDLIKSDMNFKGKLLALLVLTSILTFCFSMLGLILSIFTKVLA